MTSGRFDTITRTKIKTPYGTVLKVTRYEEDSNPDTEYKVRPICTYCKEPVDCYCFNDNDFENALESAIELLQCGMVCDTPKCVIKIEMVRNPKNLEMLKKIHHDKYELRDAIQESWPECDEGPEECGV